MHAVADAVRAVLDRLPALPPETIALAAAQGRFLAGALHATRPLPGFDNSAMDGYAARSADLPGTLPVIATVAAGDVRREPVPTGAAVRIFTGAPLPPGVDTIVMQEDATRDGDRVTLPAAAIGDHVRCIGEDLALGDLVLIPGTRLGAGELGVLAALGVAHVPVGRAPRVAILATGDELVDVATAPGFGQLVDSSAHTVAALIRDCGGVPSYLGIIPDDRAATAAAITRALDHDVVLTTGGVSVGDRDHVRPALAEAGVTLELWKVAMRPGKPFAFGMAGARPVFGLPGNAVSTVVAFELFVRPALLALQGAATVARPRAQVHLAHGYRKDPGRAHYLRARVTRLGAALHAEPHAKQGSSMMSSLIGCNALIEIAAETTEILPGGLATALLLEAV
jgi:molybdopterin molybdotransferase